MATLKVKLVFKGGDRQFRLPVNRLREENLRAGAVRWPIWLAAMLLSTTTADAEKHVILRIGQEGPIEINQRQESSGYE